VKKLFVHYARPAEDSVFGRISHYYAGVETNNRGALHLHGLMWLEGNLDLPTGARRYYERSRARGIP
jgi:Helitron helicase-like domain at N-terminus